MISMAGADLVGTRALLDSSHPSSFARSDDKVDDNTCEQRQSGVDNHHREMRKYSERAN